MKKFKPHLPYFDAIFSTFEEKDSSVARAFSENVHWGYWENPYIKSVSPENYFEAARNLSKKVIDAARIEESQKILDVACGLGGTIRLLNENFQNLDITGLNIDSRQLIYAKHNLLNGDNSAADFTCADAVTLPYKSGTLDRITVVEAIFHFSGREKFFAEAHRVLKPGGYLALSDFIPVKQIAPEKWFAWKRFKPSFFGDFDLRYTIEDYRRLAAETGFEPVLTEDITKNTLPTYKFLSDNSKEFTKNSSFSRFQIFVLAFLSRMNLLRYYVLAFKKPM